MIDRHVPPRSNSEPSACTAVVDPCTAKIDYSTGQPLPMNQQFNADPQYVVRAWQGLITYMLIDHRFGFEP